MDKLQKLLDAKDLLLQVESDFIKEQAFCPYEVGFSIRTLNEAIEVVQKLDQE